MKSKESEYPYYVARWDRKNQALVNFTRLDNEKDEAANMYLIGTNQVVKSSSNYIAVNYNIIKETIDDTEPAALKFNDEHIKDLMEHACKCYCIFDERDPSGESIDAEEFKRRKTEMANRTESLSILQFSKDFEQDEKLPIDMFVTQSGTQSGGMAMALIGALMGGSGMPLELRVKLGMPYKTRLGSEHQLWDPVLLIEKKSAIKVSSEDGMLDAVKNILEDNS